MAEQKLINALERETEGLRIDYMDHLKVLTMVKDNDHDGVRDQLYDMDTCQRDSIYSEIERYDTVFFEALGDM